MSDFTAKYRPRKFSDVVGQREVVKALKANKDLQVALLYGPPGTGKTTLARIYAMHVCCENGDADECGGQCKSCKAIMNNATSDILEENVGDARGIDDMRRITEWIRLKPVLLNKKILILDEVQALTKSAQNMLLKVLEEPPKHSLILLCTTDATELIEPLRQRCFQFELKRVKDEELLALANRVIVNEIREKKHKVDTEELATVVSKIIEESNGTPRKLLKKLQVWFESGSETNNIEDEEVRFYKLFDELIEKGEIIELKDEIQSLVINEDKDKIVRMFESYTRKKVLNSFSVIEMMRWNEVFKEFAMFYMPGLSDKSLLFWKIINACLKAIEVKIKFRSKLDESNA